MRLRGPMCEWDSYYVVTLATRALLGCGRSLTLSVPLTEVTDRQSLRLGGQWEFSMLAQAHAGAWVWE